MHSVVLSQPGVPSAERLSMSISTICLFAMVVFSSILVVYLVAFIAARVDLKGRAQKAWSRWRGLVPKNKRILLQTLSYYLAVTRSTCEVIEIIYDPINQDLSSDSYP